MQCLISGCLFAPLLIDNCPFWVPGSGTEWCDICSPEQHQALLKSTQPCPFLSFIVCSHLPKPPQNLNEPLENPSAMHLLGCLRHTCCVFPHHPIIHLLALVAQSWFTDSHHVSGIMGHWGWWRQRSLLLGTCVKLSLKLCCNNRVVITTIEWRTWSRGKSEKGHLTAYGITEGFLEKVTPKLSLLGKVKLTSEETGRCRYSKHGLYHDQGCRGVKQPLVAPSIL